MSADHDEVPRPDDECSSSRGPHGDRPHARARRHRADISPSDVDAGHAISSSSGLQGSQGSKSNERERVLVPSRSVMELTVQDENVQRAQPSVSLEPILTLQRI